ncbi:MAG: alkaline phosphatase [Saprospiraceae bacterium]|nr:alkaline phosphatase [Saprospiraceae bacterium]
MVNRFSISIVFAALFVLGSCTTSRNTAPIPPGIPATLFVKPQNVIFLIGDGMGLPQITGAMYMNNNTSVFERFKNIGFHKSHASDNLVTDSAAGATAFASGVKTYNGAIGVNARKESVPTLLEMAEQKQMATGLVASSSVTHATPAAFIAHVPGREAMEAIAADFLNTPVDIFIGGGMDYFVRRKTDERDLVVELTEKGYQITNFFDQEISDLDITTKKNIGYFTANGEPLPVTEGRDYLVPATTKAIDFLNERSANGFFLMIEGSQIDWGGHANDANYVVTELHEFEKVVAAALDFAARDKSTLIIVTGDHETGGFAVQPGSKLNDIQVAFTTKSHTALMIPVFAEGPGAEAFRGIYENTAIFDKLKDAMELK